MKNVSKTLIIVFITFVVTVFLIAMVCGLIVAKYDIPFEKLIKVGAIINSSYVGEYDVAECEENAINAILKSIDDKYAVYYNEKNAQETMQMIEGYYIGIGTEIFANTRQNRIEILSAYEDSPADKAGIKSGDLIVSIDSREYTAEMMADAVSYMRGIGIKNPLEESITITLLRDGQEMSFRLKREKINMYKVSAEIIDDICYIRYSGFTVDSQEELRKIVYGLDKNVKGIVIDIRNNPGGEFKSSIYLSDLFLNDGMIMYTVDKNGNKSVYNAADGSNELPLAVIVNGSTASAAEIFAGAMQSNDRAVIVGEKTYGKGVSQTIRYLNPFDKSEGALKLTTCKNYTPDGVWINEAITPDIEVKTERVNGDIRDDAAFNAAVDFLKRDK